MSNSGSTERQSDLHRFSEGGDDERDAEAEARAVAGNDHQRTDSVVDDADWLPDAEGTVELSVVQVDYTVEGSGNDEAPVVHVFGRTDDQRLEHVEVYEFEPYFYVPAENVDDERIAQYDGLIDYRETDENDQPFESIRGERLVKIIGRTPRDVGQVRDEFDHYEADILFPNRLLIDKDINSGVRVPERRDDDGNIRIHHDEIESVDASVTPRVNTFDIEVDDRQGFPEDGEETIVCLTSHDSYRDEYVNWLYQSPAGVDGPAALADYEPIQDEFEADVRVFEEEEAMLESFVDYIRKTDPDVLTGWNFADFDAPYLLDRMEELQGPHHDYDLDIDRLSRVNEVWRSDWNGPDIKGRVVFDLLRAYKSNQRTELESYRLDAVGEVELGVGKERYSGDIGDLWEDDPERLLEYNLRDVELCVELDRKQDIVAFFEEVASFVGCKLEDAPTAGDAVDMYVLHKAHGEFALPSKGTVESGEEFEGGAVFEPITGVRENVSVLDLKSLYPMCMWTVNASPETKVEPDEYDGETYRTPTGQHFKKEPAGMMREMIDELLTEREEKKTLRDQHDPGTEPYERYDNQQASVKVVMNCFTPDTDVLTPDGVRGIRDLRVGDEVYSLDPETMQMEVKPVTETHAYPDYEGELVDVETGKMDFRVTPNHRMLVRKDETNGVSWDEDDYRFVEAGDLDRATNYQLPHDWDGPDGERIDEVDLTELLDDYEVWVRPEVHGHTFAAELGYYPDKVKKNDVGKEGYVLSADEFEQHREYVDSVAEQCFVHAEPNRKWIPRTYDGDDFLELLAWYVTEGNVYTSEDEQFGEKLRGSATTVKIAQNAPTLADGGDIVTEDESDHAVIGDLLDRVGFDYYVDDRSYQFTSRLLGRFLERECGDGSFEKRIPDFVFDASQAQKRRFLDVLIDGDGDRQENSWRYSTASDRLRDDVLRLCAHLGLTANYREDSGCWRIYVTEGSKNTLRMHRSSSRSEAENGVYCVTVEDNHTLLAGRNGKFQFVGQSLYGVSGWDRFRLYDKDNAAAVTATGREVINYTEDTVTDFGYDVIYGDTDSVMLEVGQDVPKSEAVEDSFELEERINDSYDGFATEELNAYEHRFQIEFEKLYRRFFQAGTKKRYAGHIVWKEGKDVDDIDITGFEYKRSDIAPITKEVQKRVIEMIVYGEDIAKVKDYVTGVIEEFEEEETDLEKMGIPGGIGQRLDEYDTATAHIRGAKYANAVLGTNFARGSKPKRLYLEKVEPEFFAEKEAENPDIADDPMYREFKRNPGVICFEFADQIPDEFKIDYEKMLEKTLKGPIERILEALEITWEEAKGEDQQAGLDQYM